MRKSALNDYFHNFTLGYPFNRSNPEPLSLATGVSPAAGPCSADVPAFEEALATHRGASCDDQILVRTGALNGGKLQHSVKQHAAAARVAAVEAERELDAGRKGFYKEQLDA